MRGLGGWRRKARLELGLSRGVGFERLKEGVNKGYGEEVRDRGGV